MRPETFDETMRAFKNRKPFRPFTVTLVNGDKYEVDFPDALVIRDGVAVYIGFRGVPVIFDHEGVNEITGDLMNEEEVPS